jgi:hypothetical protein
MLILVVTPCGLLTDISVSEVEDPLDLQMEALLCTVPTSSYGVTTGNATPKSSPQREPYT